MSWNVFGKKVKRKLKRIPEEEGARAQFDQATYELIVCSSLKPYDRVQAELHECLHAVIYRLSLGETSLPSDVEEILCNGISLWLMENRKMLKKRFDEADGKKNPPATALLSTKTK